MCIFVLWTDPRPLAMFLLTNFKKTKFASQQSYFVDFDVFPFSKVTLDHVLIWALSFLRNHGF